MKTGYTISRASRKYPTFKILKGVNDMANMIVDNAKVMSKGQITLPKEIREQLGIGTGDRVTLICEGDQVVMMNAAVYAMKMLQGGMQAFIYTKVNAPHYWNTEYDDKGNRLCLAW